jgi:DNA primase
LTIKHAAVLRRLCDTVVLLFDGDNAGQRAADRAVEVFFAEEIDVKIATLSSVTDAKDPDELLKRQGGVDVLRSAIAKAADLLEYRYARIRERLAGAGMSALDRAVEEDLKRLVELGFGRVPLRRRMLIVKRISALTGLSERVIAQSIPAGRSQAQFGRETGEIGVRPALTNHGRALGCLLADSSLWASMTDADREAIDPAHFPEGPHRHIAEAMFELAARHKPCELSAVLTLLESQADSDAATDLYSDAARTAEDSQGRIDPAKLRGYFRDCLGVVSDPAREQPIEFVRERAVAAGPNRRVIPRPRISS